MTTRPGTNTAKPDEQKAQIVKCTEAAAQKDWVSLGDCATTLKGLGATDKAAEFQAKARELGLNIDRRGMTGYAADSPFKELLRKCGVSFGQVVIERDGFARGLFRFAPAFNGRNVAARSKNCIGVG